MKDLLESIVDKYDLKNRAWETFGNRFDKYLLEEAEESAAFGIFDRNSLESYLYSISYRIKEKTDEEQIILKFRMCYPGGSNIGFYEATFSIEGEMTGEVFFIE